jgi:hypothetical protein
LASYSGFALHLLERPLPFIIKGEGTRIQRRERAILCSSTDCYASASLPSRLTMYIPDVPLCPYYPGVILQLYPSLPPSPPTEPFPPDDVNASPERRLELYRKKFSPPLSKDALPDKSICLEMPLRVGMSSHPAQVVQVSVSPADAIVDNLAGDRPRFVAKIYDPLYYCYPEGIKDRYGFSHTCIAGETESYSRLAAIQGTFIPKFHGCFICRVPGQNRNAWVLLMQYIPGTSLDHFKASQLSSDVRRIVMEKVANAAYEIFLGGVEHRDYAPRNTILVLDTDRDTNGASPTEPDATTSAPMPSADNTPLSHETLLTVDGLSNASVFIIDFELVRFYDLSSEGYEERMRVLGVEKGAHDFSRFKLAKWVTAMSHPEISLYYGVPWSVGF